MSSSEPRRIDSFQVVTYPRSGLNLLRILLGQQYYNVSAFHNSEGIDQDKAIVTIIRSPLDTVSSYFSMVRNHLDSLTLPGIDKMLDTYIETYKWLLDNYSYIIDYNDLVDSPAETVEKLLDHFELPYTSMEYKVDVLKDDPNQEYLVSSKKTEWYQDSREYAMSATLIEEADDIYRQMLFAKWVKGF